MLRTSSLSKMKGASHFFFIEDEEKGFLRKHFFFIEDEEKGFLRKHFFFIEDEEKGFLRKHFFFIKKKKKLKLFLSFLRKRYATQLFRSPRVGSSETICLAPLKRVLQRLKIESNLCGNT